MKRDSWPVTRTLGPRPAGSPVHCFYCREPVGAEHKPECVMRTRTVVVRYSVEMVIRVPEDWDQGNIEFHRNEGSWCANNFIDEVSNLKDRVNCVCPFVSAEYLREATAEDEEQQALRVADMDEDETQSVEATERCGQTERVEDQETE